MDRIGDPVEADDHVRGAELGETRTSARMADRGHHLGAGSSAELHGVATDASGGAGDQHASPDD